MHQELFQRKVLSVGTLLICREGGSSIIVYVALLAAFVFAVRFRGGKTLVPQSSF